MNLAYSRQKHAVSCWMGGYFSRRHNGPRFGGSHRLSLVTGTASSYHHSGRGCSASWGQKWLSATAYHPQTDGKSERTDQWVEIALRYHLTLNPAEDFTEVLPYLQATLNKPLSASSDQVLILSAPTSTHHPTPAYVSGHNGADHIYGSNPPDWTRPRPDVYGRHVPRFPGLGPHQIMYSFHSCGGGS